MSSSNNQRTRQHYSESQILERNQTMDVEEDKHEFHFPRRQRSNASSFSQSTAVNNINEQAKTENTANLVHDSFNIMYPCQTQNISDDQSFINLQGTSYPATFNNMKVQIYHRDFIQDDPSISLPQQSFGMPRSDLPVYPLHYIEDAQNYQSVLPHPTSFNVPNRPSNRNDAYGDFNVEENFTENCNYNTNQQNEFVLIPISNQFAANATNFQAVDALANTAVTTNYASSRSPVKQIIQRLPISYDKTMLHESPAALNRHQTHSDNYSNHQNFYSNVENSPQVQKYRLQGRPPSIASDEKRRSRTFEERAEFKSDDNITNVVKRITIRKMSRTRDPDSIEELKHNATGLSNVQQLDIMKHQGIISNTAVDFIENRYEPVAASPSQLRGANFAKPNLIPQMKTTPEKSRLTCYPIPNIKPGFKSQSARRVQPTRTMSQTNVHKMSSGVRNTWKSEYDLDYNERLKHMTAYNTYSAHRENIKDRRRISDFVERSSRQSSSGFGEVRHDSVSLHPIGRGVHDLATPMTPATVPRLMTKYTGRSHSVAGDASSGMQHRNMSARQSPSSFRRNEQTIIEHSSRQVRNELPRPTNSSARANRESSIVSLLGPRDGTDSRNSIFFSSKDTIKYWLYPSMSHDEANSILLQREPGSFIIRQNNLHPLEFILLLRVSRSQDNKECVLSYVIDQLRRNEGQSIGFLLRSFDSEQVYPTLADFVQAHVINRGALPICLRPTTCESWQTAPAVGTRGVPVGELLSSILYLGSYDVHPLKSTDAVRRAVEKILSDFNNPKKGLKRKCEAEVMATPGGNVSIIDKSKSKFDKKTFDGRRIRFCGYDPNGSVINCPELSKRGITDSKIFGIVVKKTRFAVTETAVYVMCQLDPSQPSSTVVNYINQNFPSSTR